MSFWGELTRRNVVQVGAAYAILAWLIAQVASIFAPALNLPDWTMTFVVFLLILGFPMALFFAWAYEITPQGVKRTKTVPLAESITHVTGQRLNYVVTGLLVLAVTFLAIDNYLLDRSGGSAAGAPETTTSVEPGDSSLPPASAQPAGADVLTNSVAVIPCTNLSPNEDDAYFAAAIHEEILNQLVKLSNLSVIARTSVMQYANTTKTIPQIAGELNIETVMECSVRYAGDGFLVTAQLIDAGTGSHLFSNTYSGDRSDVSTHFEIQADIAMNVANALQAEFSTEERERLEQAPTQSLEAYELYLAARAYLTNTGSNAALDAVNEALAVDERFALAWALKSEIHSLRAQAAYLDRYDEEDEAVVQAAQRAVELAPDSAAIQDTYAAALGRRAQWQEAERAFRRAATLSGSASRNLYGIHSLAVGKFDEAREVFGTLRRGDPLNQIIRGFYLLSLSLSGEPDEADSELERGAMLFGQRWFGNWYATLARLGVPRYSSLDGIPEFRSIQNEARMFLDSPDEGIAALRANYEQNADRRLSDLLEYAIWGAYFGDSQFALDALEELVSRNAYNVLNAWIPAMREVRQESRFKDLISDLGLVSYWDEYGWPQFCRRTSSDDFDCD